MNQFVMRFNGRSEQSYITKINYDYSRCYPISGVRQRHSMIPMRRGLAPPYIINSQPTRVNNFSRPPPPPYRPPQTLLEQRLRESIPPPSTSVNINKVYTVYQTPSTHEKSSLATNTFVTTIENREGQQQSQKRKVEEVPTVVPEKKIKLPHVNTLSATLSTASAKKYCELVTIENRMDDVIQRKLLKLQQQQKPVKKILQVTIKTIIIPGTESHYYPYYQKGTPTKWKLLIEGGIVTEDGELVDKDKTFSSHLESFIIILDETLYGPDHILQWRRSPNGTKETEGFQVLRDGNKNVKFLVLFTLRQDSKMFSWNKFLLAILGLPTEKLHTTETVIKAWWIYVKNQRLQDPNEYLYINCDENLRNLFKTDRVTFREALGKLDGLKSQLEPLRINHVVNVKEGTGIQTIDFKFQVELEDTDQKERLGNLIKLTQDNEEEKGLGSEMERITRELTESEVRLKFFNDVTQNPLDFMNKFSEANCQELKTMQDITGNPEEERRNEFYYKPEIEESVSRYMARNELRPELTKSSEMP